MEQDIINKNNETIASLRAMADFLEANPVNHYSTLDLISFCHTKDELVRVAREYAPVAKDWSGEEYFGVEKHFGKYGKIRWIIDRDKVCEKVVTTEKIMRPVFADPTIIGEKEVEVQKVEWKCCESLLRPPADKLVLDTSHSEIGVQAVLESDLSSVAAPL